MRKSRSRAVSSARQPGCAEVGVRLPGCTPVPSRDPAGFPPAIERGLREIAAADRPFDLLPFLEGAKAAYRMILEAFWRGDKDELRALCDETSMRASPPRSTRAWRQGDARQPADPDRGRHGPFGAARRAMARIAVRFVADIATVTRDKDGNLIAGSLDDAIESRDIWTFSRDVTSAEPDWLLDETDEG